MRTTPDNAIKVLWPLSEEDAHNTLIELSTATPCSETGCATFVRQYYPQAYGKVPRHTAEYVPSPRVSLIESEPTALIENVDSRAVSRANSTPGGVTRPGAMAGRWEVRR